MMMILVAEQANVTISTPRPLADREVGDARPPETRVAAVSAQTFSDRLRQLRACRAGEGSNRDVLGDRQCLESEKF